MKGGCKGGEREGGECKLMEKRHEDYYRLISSHDDDRKLEGERGSERGGKWREGGELEERRNVSPAAAAAASLPSLDLTLSVRPSRRPRDE